MRLVILNGLPLNAFPIVDCIKLTIRKMSLSELTSIIKSTKEIQCYIRHQGTISFLNEKCGISLTPSADLYKYQHGDTLLIVTLKTPQRGQEIQKITEADIDFYMCTLEQ